MSPEVSRRGALLHEAARLLSLRFLRGELTLSTKTAAENALASEALDYFRARWLDFQWLASDSSTPPDALKRARSRFPPANALGKEDAVGWVYRRLDEGRAAGQLDAKGRRWMARA